MTPLESQMTKVCRNYHFRSCKHKKPYISLKVGLDIVLDKRKNGIDVDSVYKCIFCGHYHIGHYPVKKHRTLHRKIIRTLLQERTTYARIMESYN